MRRIFRIEFTDGTLGYQISDDWTATVHHDDGSIALDASYTTIDMAAAAPAWLAPAPVPEPTPAPELMVVPAGRFIFPYSFRARFTMPEKIAIEAVLADTAHPLSMALRAADKDLQAARRVDLDLPATRDGVMALEQAGIIGAGRALVILDSPITDDERA